MDHVLSDNPIEYLFIDGLRRWLDVNLSKNNLLKTSLNCRLAKFLITHCSLFTLTLRSEVLKRSNRETVRPPNNGRLLKYLGSESTRHVLIQTEKILSGRLHFGKAKYRQKLSSIALFSACIPKLVNASFVANSTH